MMDGSGTAPLSTTLTNDEFENIGGAPLFAESSERAKRFQLGKDPSICDLVMKGGVTSGVVYPYAILRLATKYRLAGIGGTSAGAIAAALTAAAEYGRQAAGDPNSYCRFERRCLELPGLLSKLFQPYRRQRETPEQRGIPGQRGTFEFCNALMQLGDSAVGNRDAILRLFFTRASYPVWLVLGCMAVGGLFGAIRRVVHAVQAADLHTAIVTAGYATAAGVISGVLMLACFAFAALKAKARWPMWLYLLLLAVAAFVPIERGLSLAAVIGSALGGALGAVAGLVWFADRAMKNMSQTDYGMCSGLAVKGSDSPGITDWLHAAIQEVAGRPDGPPLTFEDIEFAVSDPDAPNLALRMITTNMTLRRPYALPDLGGAKGRVGWSPAEWRMLFPTDVVNFMIDQGPPGLPDDQIRILPDGLKLPVVVGARMSLSFPLLFSAVPVHEMTVRGNARSRMLLIDGGLSSNMPLHFFDTLGPPPYPTFAFNLDRDDKASDDIRKRVSLHRSGQRPPTLRAFEAENFLGYFDGLLGAAKDWQDNLLSIMPGQFDRIVNIGLAKVEGGLNLTMPPARSRKLMQLGYLAGEELADQFDLQAHRVRRALASYQEIERVSNRFSRGWDKGKLKKALEDAKAPVGSRQAWKRAGGDIIERFGLLADWALTIHPPAFNKYFPKPRGALRITPNLSGDR